MIHFRRGSARFAAFAAAIALAAGVLVSSSARAGHSIYFSHVVGHLGLSAVQRPKVIAIVNKSERDIRAVFARHGINPNAKPEFDKLFKARQDLEVIETWERNELKKILTKAQMKIYRQINEYTRAQVIKATRNDN